MAELKGRLERRMEVSVRVQKQKNTVMKSTKRNQTRKQAVLKA